MAIPKYLSKQAIQEELTSRLKLLRAYIWQMGENGIIVDWKEMDKKIMHTIKEELEYQYREPADVDEINYKSNIITKNTEGNLPNKKTSKTNQKYINPANGKQVSYQRAKKLGII